MKFSICIPSRGNPLGVWATIAACETQLAGYEHEYQIVFNGVQEDEPRTLLVDNSDGKVHAQFIRDPVPPPRARDIAASSAKGDWLVFLDDHVIPGERFFERFYTYDEIGMEIVHSSYMPHIGKYRYYHFLRRPDCLIMGDYSRTPLETSYYPCLAAPHGGFAVKDRAWQDIGGYGDHFVGFGGEEAFFDIKAQMMGYNVWMDPALLFYHFSCRSEVRGYDLGLNADNFILGAYLLGGTSWAIAESKNAKWLPTRAQEEWREQFMARTKRSLEDVLAGTEAYSLLGA